MFSSASNYNIVYLSCITFNIDYNRHMIFEYVHVLPSIELAETLQQHAALFG